MRGEAASLRARTGSRAPGAGGAGIPGRSHADRQTRHRPAALQIGGVSGVVLALLYFFQDKLVYVPNIPGYPTAEYWQEPDAVGLDYEVGCCSSAPSPCALWAPVGPRPRCRAAPLPPCPPAQTVWLRTKDGVKLHGWFLKMREWGPEHTKQRPVIMFFQVGLPWTWTWADLT